jgi:GWxTD domain-containing protein
VGMRLNLANAVGFVLVAALSSADERVDRLPPEYKKWLEEEVVYIITDIERDVFLELSTREERDRFIDAFWARRDPDPATLENEYRIEHYRRIDYANHTLGRDSTRPGWKTDRGRYWIILGKPMEIQRYDGYNEVVSNEIWFYNGDPALDLPARFNLLFFKDNDLGEYELYDPLGDGPHRLLRMGYASQSYQVEQHKAVDALEFVSMDLARASLTIDLTEMSYGFLAARNTLQPMELQVRPASNVQRVLADIDASPRKRVDTDYLKGYREFGHRVTADYSFRFFSSRSTFSVLYGPGNTPFLHYAFEIEPERFTFEHDDNRTRYYTTVEVDLEVRDEQGRVVAYNLNQPLLQLSAGQFEQAKSYPLAYRDNYPLIPGKYQVSVILKNLATKDYTAAEREIVVPEVVAGKPTLSDLVLAYGHEVSLSGSGPHRTFEVGGRELYPTMENVFAAGSTVHAMVQSFGAGAGNQVRFRVLNENSTASEETGEIVDGVAFKEVPLLGLENGFYTVLAELADSEGTVLASRSAPLTVSPLNAIARPAFIYRHSFNADAPGFLEMTIGNQLMASGKLQEAEAMLERAVAANNPGLPMARWRLATLVLYTRKADRALELLLPLEKDFPNEYEVVEGLGFSYYIQSDYSRARDYFERSTAIRAPDTTVLNALGDCHERLGNAGRAKELYQRSLELNPEQGGVRARLAGLTTGEP